MSLCHLNLKDLNVKFSNKKIYKKRVQKGFKVQSCDDIHRFISQFEPLRKKKSTLSAFISSHVSLKIEILLFFERKEIKKKMTRYKSKKKSKKMDQ